VIIFHPPTVLLCFFQVPNSYRVPIYKICVQTSSKSSQIPVSSSCSDSDCSPPAPSTSILSRLLLRFPIVVSFDTTFSLSPTLPLALRPRFFPVPAFSSATFAVPSLLDENLLKKGQNVEIPVILDFFERFFYLVISSIEFYFF
jgi:hypothetical protein